MKFPAPLVFSCFALAGCAVDTKVVRQDVALPSDWKNAAGFPVASPSRDLSRWWNRFGDPTLTRIIADALRDSPDILAASARITADASHELRTPLTVILSETSRGLKRDRSAEEYQEILVNCSHAATRMRSLVESLLMLARQDGHPECRRESVDLATVVAESLGLLRPLSDQHQIRISSDLQSARCLADGTALSVVAGNLIANAIGHQAPGGQAAVRVFPSGTNVILEVSDEGPGIPADHLPRLFDRFYRVDPARGGGHSGLGLVIVRAIVENHRGNVEVESVPGAGSTFRVTLPAHEG